ncbi:MAG: hypothetical protein LBL44_09980 [Treponema sp.]|jgi:hypothetical protein|nr:hypothetical protein [Treponema sp.]
MKRGENMNRIIFMVMAVFLVVSCGGKKKISEEAKTFTGKLESGLEKLSQAAEKYAQYSESERAALATSLDLMGYSALKSQILGEVTPKVVKAQYPLQKNSTAYGLFLIKVLALKAGGSLKASFNYTIASVEPDKCTIGVEHSDFASDSESGPLSVYYFGDLSAFGPHGPAVGQKFLAYVSYHASTIKVGIALPIIVIDGIKIL